MDQQIDTAAEVDQTKFWKMVNSRRKMSGSKMNGGIIFQGTVVRDRDEQLQGWGTTLRICISHQHYATLTNNFVENVYGSGTYPSLNDHRPQRICVP
ncbi:hypothetical protein DPMN_044079 [Dreissena polymorpha]|uniref:Uncharacterized protein n=1 Tax=Dreissena polymorpha TaxID=45954 RepID=A0A9D4I081_DREPO|nr:hypothetical protein DPMN_044079 [Dreissena polymorpha]